MISDLLKPEKSNLTIHEDAKRGVYVHGLSEWVVRTPDEVGAVQLRLLHLMQFATASHAYQLHRRAVSAGQQGVHQQLKGRQQLLASDLTQHLHLHPVQRKQRLHRCTR